MSILSQRKPSSGSTESVYVMIDIAIMHWLKDVGVSSRSLFASEIGEREFALELLVLMELAYSVYMGSSGYHGYITTLLHIMNGRPHLVYTLDTHSCNLPLTVWVIYLLYSSHFPMRQSFFVCNRSKEGSTARSLAR